MAPRSRPPAVINDWIKGRLPTWPKGDTLWWRAAAFHFLLFSPEAESPSPPPPLSQPLPLSHKTVPVPSRRCGERGHLPLRACACVCVCQCPLQPVWSNLFCYPICLLFLSETASFVVFPVLFFKRIYWNVLNDCTALFMAAGGNTGLLSNSSVRHIANWMIRL